MIGKMANGKTGNRIIDRYFNMTRLGTNLQKMKSQPWWQHVITEMTQDSLLGGRPGWALLAMLGMTACVTVQEGMDEYDSMELLRRQELERARIQRLETPIPRPRIEEARSSEPQNQSPYDSKEPSSDAEDAKGQIVDASVPPAQGPIRRRRVRLEEDQPKPAMKSSHDRSHDRTDRSSQRDAVGGRPSNEPEPTESTAAKGEKHAVASVPSRAEGEVRTRISALLQRTGGHTI